MINIMINGNPYEVEEGATIVSASVANGIYIPALCHHPDLPPFRDVPPAKRVFQGNKAYDNEAIDGDELRAMEGCGLCVVEVDGLPDPQRACQTPVTAGMSIRTDSEAIKDLRRDRLVRILNRHPHACLTCAQREGCSLEDCSLNVPKEERCCSQFHACELRKVVEYVGVKPETPRYRPLGLPILKDEPLYARDFNLCVDCARCVRVCNQVRGVEALGIVHHNDRLVVGSVAPTLIDSACKFCGACVEVCPTGCLTDSAPQTGDKEHWLLPCVHTCPAGVNVPEYIRRIASEDFEGASAVVWETLPLANVLGYICFHLCEYQCRRSELDDPVAICALKRFALQASGDVALRKARKTTKSGKRVAVVGAGPAGLAAAHFLSHKGHAVTIFEATETLGGMPALAIPDYRLPQAVLEKDVAAVCDLGVEIKTGYRLATDKAMVDLLSQGFDALLIAVGLPHSKRIPIEGSSLDGVLWGLEFLSAVKAGETFDLGREIIIVGGGNVAIDVAMTARRLSQGTARLFCLEGREEMPAHAHEIAKAEAEGIEVNPAWGPTAITGADGKVTGVELRRCVAVFDEQRNFAPTFDEQTRTRVDADAVILAIGQAPPQSVPAEREGVFHAGDITGGQLSAVHAVASGRAAAERIDRYLGGDGCVSLQLGDRRPPDTRIGREEGFAPRPRVPIPCEPPKERITDFRTIEGTYSPEAAVAEAKRCLQCDLRLLIAQPDLPPEKWLTLDRATVDGVPAIDGVFVLADSTKRPIMIKGTADIQAGLLEKIESGGDACLFYWEEDPMYTKRESELIEQHLSQYGELPGGGDDELDDLF